MKPELTAERLRELLHYDPETGVFTRRSAVDLKRYGPHPGSVDKEGYLRIQIDGSTFFLHRLAWLYMTGAWPNHLVDHKDGVKRANHWTNLRDATRAVNRQNLRRTFSGSGFLGVSQKKGKFQAEIEANEKRHYLGTFETPELAHNAYVKAKRQLHPGCML